MTVAERIKRIQKNIPDSVTLIAVSKTKTVSDIITAAQAGIQHFGENYLQEAIPKIEFLENQFFADKPITWHYLGQLQSRKLKAIVEYFTVVHSLDRLDHAQKLNQFAKAAGKKLQVFVQVNLDHELQKGGILAEELESFLGSIEVLDHIEILGLMLIPKPDRAEQTLVKFKRLKYISDHLRPKTQGGLSMGMSEDYQLAINAGATHIRIGTAIFGERD